MREKCAAFKSFRDQFYVLKLFFIYLRTPYSFIFWANSVNKLSNKHFTNQCKISYYTGPFLQPGPRFLWIPVFLRLLFIPAFLLCNYHPVNAERIMPVLIDSDWAYWVMAIFLGLSSGYYSSLAMMYCPKWVKDKKCPSRKEVSEKEWSQNEVSLFSLIIGLVTINLRWVDPRIPWFIKQVHPKFHLCLVTGQSHGIESLKI